MRSCVLLTINFIKMQNNKENDKKWIETLQERNRVLEEILQLTQIENEKLKEELRIGAVEGRSKQFYCFNEKNKRIDRCENQCTTCKELKLMQ